MAPGVRSRTGHGGVGDGSSDPALPPRTQTCHGAGGRGADGSTLVPSGQRECGQWPPSPTRSGGSDSGGAAAVSPLQGAAGLRSNFPRLPQRETSLPHGAQRANVLFLPLQRDHGGGSPLPHRSGECLKRPIPKPRNAWASKDDTSHVGVPCPSQHHSLPSSMPSPQPSPPRPAPRSVFWMKPRDETLPAEARPACPSSDGRPIPFPRSRTLLKPDVSPHVYQTPSAHPVLPNFYNTVKGEINSENSNYDLALIQTPNTPQSTNKQVFEQSDLNKNAIEMKHFSNQGQ